MSCPEELTGGALQRRAPAVVMGGESLYSVLGLDSHPNPSTCTLEEIKAAYRKAALRTHPDKALREDGTEAGVGAHPDSQSEAFLDVQRAWRTLSDPKERYRYDEELLRGAEGSSDDGDDYEEADKEVRLDEMRYDETDRSYGFPCRCGDTFTIHEEETPEGGASVLLPCLSCSLLLCVKGGAELD